jgi:hypothetical protein
MSILPADEHSSVRPALRALLLLITCGSRSGGGVKFLLAPGLVSLILPLHFRPLLALVFSLKGLIVEKPPGLARIRTVDVLTIGADHPDLSESGARSYPEQSPQSTECERCSC